MVVCTTASGASRSDSSEGTSLGFPGGLNVDGGGETVDKRGQWRDMKSGGMKEKLVDKSKEQLRFIELIEILKRIPSSRTGNGGDVVDRSETRQGFAAPTMKSGREFRQAFTSHRKSSRYQAKYYKGTRISPI